MAYVYLMTNKKNIKFRNSKKHVRYLKNRG